MYGEVQALLVFLLFWGVIGVIDLFAQGDPPVVTARHRLTRLAKVGALTVLLVFVGFALASIMQS